MNAQGQPSSWHLRFARAALFAVSLAALFFVIAGVSPDRSYAAGSVCALVKLEILQKATMERVGFDAQLGITNSLAASPLTSLQITISIKDKNGNPADSLFFLKVGTMTNVTALDGTGVIQPQTEGKIGWLIIPSTGAGGSAPLGQTYQVRATVNFIGNGIFQSLGTLDAPITVMPQPFLRLQYVLPRDVEGDDPMTEVVESSSPYMLGLRVVNEGYGTAQDLKVESGQPRVVSNVNGLAVNFKLLGAFIGTATVSNTMLLPFGNIAPGAVKLGGWQMISELRGRFIDFQASFTHDPDLGGQLTSLIGGVSTYWLLKDVLDDQPGRDAQFDFLVSTQSTLSGAHPLPSLLMESDMAQPFPVGVIPEEDVTVTGTLSSLEPVLQLSFAAPGTPGWYYITAADPTGAAVDLVQVLRSDGKALNPRNFWQSSPYYRPDEGEAPHLLRFLDFDPTGSYRLVFRQSSLEAAPDPVSDLAAFPSPGGLRLDWTSTGEDRSSGTIYNGRYAVTYSTNPSFSFSTAAAQVEISTTVAERSPESLGLEGLLGNATYFVRLALADKKSLWSPLSNGATVHTLAYPAYGGSVSGLEISSFSVSWSTAVNLSGAQYRVELTTGAEPPLETVGFAADLSSHVFTGLTPDTTYYVRSTARNSAGADSPAEVFASAVTRAQTPGAAAVPIEAVGASQVTVAWSSGTNPGHTDYFVAVATGADLPAVSTFTVTGLSSAAVAGLAPDTEYFFSVKAVNRQGVETASLPLGSTVTAAALPAGLSFSEVTPGSVTVSWGASVPDNQPYTAYKLELSTAQDFTGEILSSSTVRLPGRALINSLAVNTSYYARVTATNQAGLAGAAALSTPAFTASVAVPGAAPGFLTVWASSAAAAWDPSGNGPGTGFTLELSTDPGFSGVISSSATVFSTAAVSGLLSDTAYYARVKARAGQSESAYAGLGSTHTLAAIPGVPPEPFVEVSSAALSAAWFYSGSAQGFLLEVSSAPDFASAVLVSSQTADPGLRSLAVSGLLPGTTYYARAAALGGQGIYSYAVLGSTRTYYPAPAAGAALVALGSSSVRAAWTEGGNGEGVVYIVEASSDNFTGAPVSSATAGLSADIFGLEADTAYAFRVRVSTDNYYSLFTGLGVLATLAPRPDAAQETVLAAGPDTLSIAWARTPSGSGYRLELSTDQAFSGLLLSSATFDLAQSTLGVSGLTPNTTYFARAAGLNLEGVPNYSLLGSTMTAARAPAASGSFSASSSSLAVEWGGADNPPDTAFTVQLSTDAFATLSAAVSTSSVLWDFQGLTPNTLYAARGRAANAAGAVTDWTALGSTPTLAGLPAGGVIESVAGSTITVSWEPGANPSGTVYTAQLSLNDFASTQASSATAASSAEFYGLTANTTYYLRVRSANSAGTPTDYAALGSTATPAAAISSAPFTGVGDTFLNANWSAGGNPSGTVYEVELTSDSYSTLAASTRTSAVGFLFTDLEPNTAYEVRARALGHNGSATDFAALGSTTTFALQPLALAFSEVGASALTANWEPNGNPGGTVFLCQLSTNAFASIYASSSTVNSFAEFSGAGANTAYASRVQVQGAAIFTSLGSTATWAAVPGFAYTAALSAGSLRANWLAGANPPGSAYEAEISTDNFATPRESLSTNNLFQVFTGLQPNRAYDLRVRALGVSGPPAAFTALGSSVTHAAPPAAAPISDVSTAGLRLAWTANGNPSGTRYLAQLSTNSFASVYAASDTAATDAYFTGLAAGAAYAGRVQAFNSSGAGTSFTGLGSTATLGAQPPGSPALIAIDSISVAASWTDNGNLAGTVYSAQISTDGFASLSGSSSTLYTSSTFTALMPNTTYEFRVQAAGSQFSGSVSTPTPAARPAAPAFGVVGTSSAVFSWSEGGNPSGTHYMAEISSDNATVLLSSQTLNAGVVFGTGGFGSGLVPNATYYFKVKAVSHAGVSTEYVSGSTWTRAEPPSGAVLGVQATDNLTVFWSTANASGTIYQVELATSADFAVVDKTQLSAAGAINLVMTGLTSNTTYYSRVTALAYNGQNAAGGISSGLSTLSNAPAIGPLNAAAATTLTANWTNNSNSVGTLYRVDLATGSGFTTVDKTQVSGADATSLVMVSLTPNTTYYSRVTALANSGADGVSGISAAAVTLAAQPGAGPLSSVTDSSAGLSWTDNGNPAWTSYLVQASTDAYVTVQQSTFTSTNVIFSGLLPASAYSFQVQAVNSAGIATGFTPLGSTVTLQMPYPVPQNVLASAASATALDFVWTLDTPAAEAPLAALSADAAFTSLVSSAVLAAGTQAANYTGLSPNTTYWFKVKVSTVPDSAYSAVISTWTRAVAPVSASLSSPATGSLLLSWSAEGNPGDTVYSVELSSSGFPVPPVRTMAVSLSSGGLQANTAYEARVTAVDRGGRIGAASASAPRSTLALAPAAAGTPLVEVFTTSATLAWTPRPGAPAAQSCRGYRLAAYSSTTYSTVFASSATADFSLSTLTIRGLVPGVTFYFRVGSLNADGEANWLALGSAAGWSESYTGATVDAALETVVELPVAAGAAALAVTNARLEVPPGAFPDGTVVSVNVEPAAVPPPSPGDRFTAAGSGIDLSAGGLQPGVRVAVRLRFDRAKLPGNGANVTMNIGRYDPAGSRWQLLPTAINWAVEEAVAETDHFSLFNLFVMAAAVTLDDVKIYPIPWKPGSGDPRFDAGAVAFRNLTYPAKVTIYSLLGEKVWSGASDAAGELDWPGTNYAGRGAASGVYLSVIEGGSRKITRRVVVIR